MAEEKESIAEGADIVEKISVTSIHNKPVLSDFLVKESEVEKTTNAQKSEAAAAQKPLRKQTSFDMVDEPHLKVIHLKGSYDHDHPAKKHAKIANGDPHFGRTHTHVDKRKNNRLKTKVPVTTDASPSLMRLIRTVEEVRSRHKLEMSASSSLGIYDPNNCHKLKVTAIPAPVRLHVRRKDRIENIRQRHPIPSSALPSTSLPEWRVMTLDNKIPYVPAPAGAMVFSRGAIGRSIQVKQKDFTLKDPKNIESRESTNYNGLHDPHAASYFNKPVVQQVLKKNGLINDSGEVICSLKEFNNYRAYLRMVYNESLLKSIKEEDSKSKYENEIKKKLKLECSQTSEDGQLYLRAQKRKQAVISLRNQRESFLKRYEAKQERDKHMYRCHIENKICQRLNSAIISLTKTENHRNRLRQLALIRNSRLQQIKAVVVAKEKAAEERLGADKSNIVDAYKHFVTEWLVAKFENQEKRLFRDEQVRKSLDEDLEGKSQNRLIRLEKHRAMLGYLNLQHQLRDKKLWANVRKFFIRWRDRVRYLRKLRPDEKHRSMWDVTDSLKRTNEYLKEQIGPSKFKNFVFGIVMVKAHPPPEPEPKEAEETEGEEEEEEDMTTKEAIVSSLTYITDKKPEDQESKPSKTATRINAGSKSPSRSQVDPNRAIQIASKYNFKSQYQSRKQLGRYLSRAGSRLSRRAKPQKKTSKPTIVRRKSTITWIDPKSYENMPVNLNSEESDGEDTT